MEENIKLTDLIEVDTLQMIQDAFSEICNLTVGISDENGVLVTPRNNSIDFCKNYNKKSPIGRMRCEACDKRGGALAANKGQTVMYHCHAGIVDFAAPIMANGRIVGNITGGQVRTEELDEAKLRQIAEEIQVDPDGYVEASRKIRYISPEELKVTTKFLHNMSKIISEMAYDRYALHQAKDKVEHVAQLKSDFLANMSHEIRTPMNAVIGMAEMALREELPPEARKYVSQIKSSGKTLLRIINDILDFSKIEAGKMTVEEEEYEIMSLINEVANIIITRIGDKDIELILDIDPNLPRMLKGDINRLEQIIINLTNKFTREGQVVLKVSFVRKSEEEILLAVSVQDTGVGIKEEELDKLFEAFRQADSKRNRNIEGTGLGLAISKQLAELMGGQLWADSVYGKGSTFSFTIPQRIVDRRPSVEIDNRDEIVVAGLVLNGFLRNHMEKDMNHLGVRYIPLEKEEELDMLVEKNVKWLFVGQAMYTDTIKSFLVEHPEITGVLMIDFKSDIKSDVGNLLVVKKPVYVLNIASLLNGEELITTVTRESPAEFDFTAPEAQVLLVDDNAINLMVAEGLLKPLQMQIDKASGGRQAVEMIEKKRYDLILMDHMMPELDGVEVTHIIRHLHPEYDDVPIIALTANAVSGVKEMFIKEGMNDFIAKPIEMRSAVSKLKAWLPPHKVKKACGCKGHTDCCEETKSAEAAEKPGNSLSIEGLDTETAIKLLGSEDLYRIVLKEYCRTIKSKAKLIKELEEKEDWHGYTIEVHALKSASKQIGAFELAEKALLLEQAGNATDAELIHEKTDEALEQYLSYEKVLEPFCREERKDDFFKSATDEICQRFFGELREALDELDMERLEEIIGDMGDYRYGERQDALYAQLKEAADRFDVDCCEEIIWKWENLEMD